jgi:hypothetical protein
MSAQREPVSGHPYATTKHPHLLDKERDGQTTTSWEPLSPVNLRAHVAALGVALYLNRASFGFPMVVCASHLDHLCAIPHPCPRPSPRFPHHPGLRLPGPTIQTPFYPLVVSYGRIKGVRPNTFRQVFSPSGEKAARQRWLRPYWGRTALVVELSKYPFSKTWLRLWFSPYLLAPDVTGFVFLVEDWMTLSRQLDQFRADWGMRRAVRL